MTSTSDIEAKVAYHLKSIRLCFVRESMGGSPAAGSGLMVRSIKGLLDLGCTEEQIAIAIQEKYNELLSG